MNYNLSYQYIALSSIASLILGYIVFLCMKAIIPRRLKSEYQRQKSMVLSKANQRRKLIIKDAENSATEKYESNLEELELDIVETKADFETESMALDSQSEFIEAEQKRLDRTTSVTQNKEKIVNELADRYESESQKLKVQEKELQKKYAEIVEVNIDSQLNEISEKIVTERKLDSQKQLKEVNEEIKNNTKRYAYRVLGRLSSRYQPDFVWPKSSSSIEVSSQKVYDSLTDPNCSLITDLRELTEGVDINLSSEKDTHMAIKLGGGYGIYKEAAIMTLEDLINKPQSAWGKADRIYKKHRQSLENHAFKIGQQATNILELKNIHPEIQKMVGALNWRTSYRQNQYFHSLEVAQLAGLLANEMGEDPDIAKRCGLLHDIGKGIDYRIEGSHAVISGDYADRYGENQVICNTVMSHHNDLVMETPMSYILKTADTLSGARPGARVNLEEGYQIRLSAIDQVVRSFPGILKIAIMNGGREVHIDVNHNKVKENQLESFTSAIAEKIEQNVAYPGQIKVLVSRRFEATSVA